ncbi:MAG: hypothetical protein VKI83_00430 [Synechococcaceae cyanobacterium]|nr:hypothetical protein [Synechococcaceae cyanobacterium]
MRVPVPALLAATFALSTLPARALPMADRFGDAPRSSGLSGGLQLFRIDQQGVKPVPLIGAVASALRPASTSASIAPGAGALEPPILQAQAAPEQPQQPSSPPQNNNVNTILIVVGAAVVVAGVVALAGGFGNSNNNGGGGGNSPTPFPVPPVSR